MNWSKRFNVLESIFKNDSLLIPLELGCYRFLIKEKLYKREIHGVSNIIYIGGMKPAEDSTLRKRIGQFLFTALGFPGIKHSGGKRFFNERENHKLSPKDLLLQFCISNDPIFAECDAFDEFELMFGKGKKPLLCRNRPRKRCTSHLKV